MSTDPRPLPPMPPLPALDYADARPTTSQLHCETTADGVRVWRDPPSRSMLVVEFVVPLISFVIPGGWIAIIAVMVARTGLAGLPELVRQRPFATLGFLPLCGFFIYRLFSAWQNAGIVTRIEIADGYFTWIKQTLFGFKTYRWPADTITAVRVRSIERILQISRRGGPALGAFSRCGHEELAWAADAIRAALGLGDQ